jgi:hypothetical protein
MESFLRCASAPLRFCRLRMHNKVPKCLWHATLSVSMVNLSRVPCWKSLFAHVVDGSRQVERASDPLLCKQLCYVHNLFSSLQVKPIIISKMDGCVTHANICFSWGCGCGGWVEWGGELTYSVSRICTYEAFIWCLKMADCHQCYCIYLQ